VNAGLSVSGLQHVGRLRGEITLSQLLTRSLEEEGRRALQSLVLYTQDEWKGTEGQIGQFTKEDGKQYVGVEFNSPEMNFWHMQFPIPGAKPLRRIFPNKASA